MGPEEDFEGHLLSDPLNEGSSPRPTDALEQLDALPLEHYSEPLKPPNSFLSHLIPSEKWRLSLYLSYFLSSWSARMEEFATVVLLLGIFKGTLFYAAVLGFVTTGAALIGGQSVGWAIDRSGRLFGGVWEHSRARLRSDLLDISRRYSNSILPVSSEASHRLDLCLDFRALQNPTRYPRRSGLGRSRLLLCAPRFDVGNTPTSQHGQFDIPGKGLGCCCKYGRLGEVDFFEHFDSKDRLGLQGSGAVAGLDVPCGSADAVYDPFADYLELCFFSV